MQTLETFGKSSFVCTLAIYFRVFEGVPLLLAANRDERYDRPSAPPALLNSGPMMLAGKDLHAGGTWLGVNEHGLTVAMLNRRSNGATLPPGEVRSRGLLCMDLLGHRSTAATGDFMREHRARYNPFTALVANLDQASVFYNHEGMIRSRPLRPGLHVFSSAAEFGVGCDKAERAHRLFSRFGEQVDFRRMDRRQMIAALQAVLGDHSLAEASADPGDAICVHRQESGTVSSGIVVVSAADAAAEFFHCEGAPCRNSFGAAQTLEIK